VHGSAPRIYPVNTLLKACPLRHVECLAARACSSSCARAPKTGTPEFFREHLHAHESYFASYGDSFIFRGPIRSPDGADNIGTALLLELPDRAAADKFWNEEPFAKKGGYRGDSRITRWVFGD